jgi:hypothetical protein
MPTAKLEKEKVLSKVAKEKRRSKVAPKGHEVIAENHTQPDDSQKNSKSKQSMLGLLDMEKWLKASFHQLFFAGF